MSKDKIAHPAESGKDTAQSAVATARRYCDGTVDEVNARANAVQERLAELGDAIEASGDALSDVATATDVPALEDAARRAQNHAQAAIAQASEVIGVAGRILGLCEAERIAARAAKTLAAVASGELRPPPGLELEGFVAARAAQGEGDDHGQ